MLYDVFTAEQIACRYAKPNADVYFLWGSHVFRQ